MNEIFGPTIQGEGHSAGIHCMFVRLADCNLACTWCDTPYSWAFTRAKIAKHQSATERSGEPYSRDRETTMMSIDEIWTRLSSFWPMFDVPTSVIISGGEPMLQQHNLVQLCKLLQTHQHKVHIETAGTLRPIDDLDFYVDQFNVSPKLAHSGNDPARSITDALFAYSCNDKAWFKFVVKTLDDLNEVSEIADTYKIKRQRIQVMPEGQKLAHNLEVLDVIKKKAISMGFGISLRSHVILWGDKRGV